MPRDVRSAGVASRRLPFPHLPLLAGVLVVAGCGRPEVLQLAPNREVVEVTSPDGRVTIAFTLGAGAKEQGVPVWSVRREGKAILEPSRLGLVCNVGSLTSGMRITGVEREEYATTWTTAWGTRREVPDSYRELRVTLESTDAPRRRLQVELRAYDEGAALRYVLPAQPDFTSATITAERTEFTFPPGARGYAEYGTEGEYSRVPINQVRDGCACPFTVELADGSFAAIGEACVQGYARSLLNPGRRPETVVSALQSSVPVAAPFVSPWRFVIVGGRPGDLVGNAHLVQNLNPPVALPDTSWVRPGKAIRDVTLSTAGGRACVDFAAAHGLAYVLFDAGWYGPEMEGDSDARTVTVDPKRGREELDLPAVIAYARSKDIGVILYVNRRALERQLDEILPLYEAWGVRGIKFGFVQVGPPEWTDWLRDAVRQAAEHHLIVDVHDAYRPDGLNRTYPNLLTQEGVRGNEHMPTARHNVTLPFTRGLAGPTDYTICWESPRIQTTRAHQLALSVIVFSPLQLLYWYDRPAEITGPGLAFFDQVPTTWDETRVIGGRIGEWITVARRHGRDWFIGSATNEDARDLDLPLDFLSPGVRYVARIFRDGEAAPGSSRPPVVEETRAVQAGDTLRLHLAGSGGQAIWITPGDLPP